MKSKFQNHEEIIFSFSRYKKIVNLATSKFRAGVKLLVNWLDREIC